MVELSSKVKQANFRLPLEYMSMIDDFASRENITKAAVITRALDCMQASYDSGNGGMPVTGSGSGASEQEINDLKNQLKQAEERVQAAEQRANDAVMARDAAEAKARDTATELAAEQAKASLAAAIPQVAPAADTAELDRLKELVAKQEASLEEKTKALAAKEAEVAAKEAQLAERDARITLSQRAARCGKRQGSTRIHRSGREHGARRRWWFTRRRFSPCADHA